MNSSYFGEDGRRELASLARRLQGSGGHRVRLIATVGSGDVAGVSREEAARYNRWLADRRIERVEGWLQENAGGGDLRIERQYRDGNERQVEVRLVAPAG